MNINKLYRYYLKKIFLRTWAFWTTIILLLVVWFLLPFLIYYRFKDLTVSDLKLMDYSEDAQKIEKEGFKGYSSLVYSRKLEQNYQNHLTKMEQAGQTEGANLTQEKLRIMRDFNLRTIFYYKLIDFFSYNKQDRKFAEKFSFWKLIHELSLWDLTGLVVSFFLTYNILDLLFISPRHQGEESWILTTITPSRRREILLSKVFASLTFFAIFSLVSFVFPCAFYYWWVGVNPSFGHFALLAFWMVVIGPILFFLFPLTLYLYFTNYVSPKLDSIFKYLLIFFAFIWEFIKWIPNSEAWTNQLEKWYFNPLFYTLSTLAIGTVFLILYYRKYQKEDLK